MTNRRRDYDERFYEAQIGGSYRSAVAVLRIVFAYFVPASVVDLGCGAGTWLRAAKELGAKRILGLDGDHVARRLLQIDQSEFVPIDLERKRPTLAERFDLAMSLEVAEHLPQSRAENFVEDLCRASDTVLFSAAIPGQGGAHHVNEQFPSFWIPMFSNHGFRCYDVIRPEVWDKRELEVWYRQNALIFSRSNVFTGATRQWDGADLVHPELWDNRPGLRKLVRKARKWLPEQPRS